MAAPQNDGRKQLPLRLSAELYGELVKWAADDFRSVNGQIEYLLSECVKKHRKSGGAIPDFPAESENVKK